MEFKQFSQVAILLGMVVILIFFVLCKVLYSWLVLPKLKYQKLKENGFEGPAPSFPLGNINEMKKELMNTASSATSSPSLSALKISHDIHSLAFPYFAKWQKLHGKVFIYWLGTEPFVYIADPEFIKKMSAGVMGKSWGKPTVFKRDRKAMFGKGLVMVEGDEWVRHRHLITPAFTQANVKGMASLMAESAKNMLDRWTALIDSGNPEINVEKEIINTAGEIIAKTSFGINYENGEKVFNKLRSMQFTLFKSTRYVGVPYGNLIMCPKETLKAHNLGMEIDSLLMSIIEDRKKMKKDDLAQHDLLSLLLAGNGKTLSTRELVDECKTFFFGGHETTALALTWTLLLLAVHPEWQTQLREEIKQVMGDAEIDPIRLACLRKMGWVMNEVLRLYSPAPNVQRQTREDIKVDNVVIPKGTNMWIDLVSMHHDKQLWGEDVNEFKPERFKDDMIHGGCKHKMGYLPFGFGGRMCIGRNLTMMEFKVVLSLILTNFSFSISPNYRHCPSIMLSLRPTQGLPLIFQPL
ncbi:cytokinin hydroxylase-like [Nicotiana tomentosiformis]|uniref:cytokinin hydroxylase-like n=1 Tax=Nicotiana tomentosiformis TaxID=4098 RepID=UPI00051AF329|nr:cytokinin hydroxylase-like [Nicotiana tomentosiformis]